MLKKIGCTAAIVFFLTSAAVSQEDGRYDVNLGVAGLFPGQTSANGIVQNATKSGAFLATGRVHFKARHSIEANVARGSDSQLYTTPYTFRIQSHVTEFSGAYVFNFSESRKLEPFIFAGGGVLIFGPFNTFVQTIQVPVPSTRQNEPAFLYGGGVDWKIFSDIRFIRNLPAASHLALRLQYRGLIYKAPDFHNPTLFTGSLDHTAEAAAGIVIKF